MAPKNPPDGQPGCIHLATTGTTRRSKCWTPHLFTGNRQPPTRTNEHMTIHSHFRSEAHSLVAKGLRRIDETRHCSGRPRAPRYVRGTKLPDSSRRSACMLFTEMDGNAAKWLGRGRTRKSGIESVEQRLQTPRMAKIDVTNDDADVQRFESLLRAEK